MFEIKAAYSKSPTGSNLMVVDESRDVWLQRIKGNGAEPGDYFKLVWKGKEIAFFLDYENLKDESGEDYTVQRISGFAGRAFDLEGGKVEPWRADTPDHKREAMLLAVEALLAYGGLYDGYEYKNG